MTAPPFRRWYRYWAAEPAPVLDGARAPGALKDEAAPPDMFHVEHPPGGEVSPEQPVAGTAVSPPAAEQQPAQSTTVDEPVRPRRYRRAHVLVVANQKGGVGKTTTAVSLAAALAEAHCRTLLVDLDPQGNATSGVGVRVQPGQATIYSVLVADELDLDEAIEPTAVRNLFLVPSNLDLAGAEIELVSAFSREQRLRRALESVRDEFDVILVDCPPSLGLLTVNALTAGDGILVPIQCEYYALEGLGALHRNTELVQRNLNPTLTVAGYIMTMADSRTRLSQQVVDEVRAHFGEQVFQTQIPRSVRLAEAPSYGQPIGIFDPSSRGARAYRRLARELLERLDRKEAAQDPASERA